MYRISGAFVEERSHREQEIKERRKTQNRLAQRKLRRNRNLIYKPTTFQKDQRRSDLQSKQHKLSVLRPASISETQVYVLAPYEVSEVGYQLPWLQNRSSHIPERELIEVTSISDACSTESTTGRSLLSTVHYPFTDQNAPWEILPQLQNDHLPRNIEVRQEDRDIELSKPCPTRPTSTQRLVKLGGKDVQLDSSASTLKILEDCCESKEFPQEFGFCESQNLTPNTVNTAWSPIKRQQVSAEPLLSTQLHNSATDRVLPGQIQNHTISGKTTLHLAAENGHEVIVQYLLDSVANINNTDDSGFTALHEASMNGWIDVVTVLLNEGADLEARDHSGCTALHIAAIHGHEDIIRLLIQTGMDLDIKVKKDAMAFVH